MKERLRRYLQRNAVALLALGLGTSAAAAEPGFAPAPHGLCFNYGHDGYVHDLSPGGQVARDFHRLSQAGISCLRIVYNGFDDVQAEALALFAKRHGFYVISGGEWGMLDASQLVDYRAKVLAQAQWAQAHRIDQFSIGNEQELRLSGISFARWAHTMTAIAAAVRGVYSGRVSYEGSGNFAADWAKADIGGLDLLGLNLYGGYDHDAEALRRNIAAHGLSHVYMSETNCDVSHVALCRTDAGLATEMKGDLLRLIAEFPQTAFYVYTWRASGADAALGLVNYPKTLALLGIR